MGVLYKIKRKLKLDFESKVDKLIRRVKTLKLTYLSTDALRLLALSIYAIDKKGIPGDILETGCALGGSSILIGKFKNKKRDFRIFDSFELMPEPTEKDEDDIHERFEVIKSGKSKGIDGDLYYGYEKDLLNKVKKSFELFNINIDQNNIHFIKGYYEDTLKIDKPVALAHIDCDWYDSVMVSLERITPFLSIGGILIIDDYYYYSGCKKATDDFFSDKKGQYKFIEKERLVIERLM